MRTDAGRRASTPCSRRASRASWRRCTIRIRARPEARRGFARQASPWKVGLREAEARELNPGFVSVIERGRPWVRLKAAASLDGRTALANGMSQWITSEGVSR
jgi:diaminohydroxyphosphoribosylaminopyrimidine deaminase/5-amino-6-(5-phosphoribosylamino)uracil reductase